MIKSVGIDLSNLGRHQVRVLDEEARVCDSFTFQTTLEGLEAFEQHVFVDGANPTIVFEPTGLAWLPLASYLRARHPESRLVRAKLQKVAALRRYLRGTAKSDRVDALTLAKMAFIDSEHLDEVYLPPAQMHALQRLTRQRDRLMESVATRKKRIGSIIDGHLPGLRDAFPDEWSPGARAFYRHKLNPFKTAREDAKAIHRFLLEADPRDKTLDQQSREALAKCRELVVIYERTLPVGTMNESFFDDLQEEIGCELRLLETEEAEARKLSVRISELYLQLDPEDHLGTIPGVGERTAPVFLGTVGEPKRFRGQSAFGNWTGVVPSAKQSSDTEGKGLRMTKAGPKVMKRSLYQAADIARRGDPQLAAVYYRQMVVHGKSHRKALGAVMSHLAARVFVVIKEGRPYELRDPDGKPISKEDALALIRSKYTVSEEVRRQRRRRNPQKKAPSGKRRERSGPSRTIEAAEAPQPESPNLPHSPVYVAEEHPSKLSADLTDAQGKPAG